uniref:Myotubularin related protein 14 n=1 Tax=Gouania willdenowi TaxID=441366 RepID=A0A8C5N3I5_GOUWI
MAAPPSVADSISAARLPGKKSEEIMDLIDLFSKTQYRAKEVTTRMKRIEKHCLELFGRDYKYSIIHNSNGEVCGHYPRQIVFLEFERTDVERDRSGTKAQINKLQDLVNRSKLARCRGRFVCPVILYNGKHVCRSSTLAGWGELYGRTGYNYIFSGGSDDKLTENEELPEEDNDVRNRDSQLFDKVRGHDIKLLRYLSVHYICDLMVENKKVKFGLNVTSSEKVDKAQRYADFTLLSVPYPGCEFFKEYKDRDYTAEGLIFNWNQDYVDAPLTIPLCFSQNLNIDWTQYQSWDLVEQTQNYLKLLLHIINRNDDSGLLVHCISGWDRTPLFVSLLRLSLWADGAVHVSLEPAEMLYLTIIFFFCFNFLKHIVSEKFSAVKKQRYVLGVRDRGSETSLSSEFSLISEEVGGASILPNDSLEVFANQPQTNPLDEQLAHPLSEARSSSSSSCQSEQDVIRTGSSPLAVPSRRLAADYTKSGSSLSTEYGSWQIVSGCGSIHDPTQFHPPLASTLSTSFQDEGPNGAMRPFPSERQVRLEAVREIFLAAYSSTIGLKSSAPSPTGAISGLLEQIARGVGLRGTNAIV